MTTYDLHTRKVDFSMVSAYYALKSLYDEFGGEIIKQAVASFEARDNEMQNTPINKSMIYSKGNSFVMK